MCHVQNEPVETLLMTRDLAGSLDNFQDTAAHDRGRRGAVRGLTLVARTADTWTSGNTNTEAFLRSEQVRAGPSTALAAGAGVSPVASCIHRREGVACEPA